MKTQLLIVLALFFILNFEIKAQDFRLGKVSIEELAEKVHSTDSTAVAAILFEKAENKLVYSEQKGFEIELVVKTRIKIYKKQGYDWATKVVLPEND